MNPRMPTTIELQPFTIVAPRSPLGRRTLLKGVGSVLAAPLAPIFDCSSSGSANDNSDGAGGGGGVDAAAGATGSLDGTGGWATGGTAAMVDKATYPNPFAGEAAASACALTCEATQGPCYAATAEEIQDISYGYAGLPTRVYLQLLDEACAPVVGATVDVWHVSAVGKYSGNDAMNENVAFCTGGDSDFTSHHYFRGRQTTDATGVVFFDTCYLGWYSGRTVHIHLIARIGDQCYLTTQTLVVRSSLASASCAIPGGAAPAGP